MGALVSATLALVAAGQVVGGSDAVASPDEGGPTTVMVVGDSISHGSTGDYTWRYFASRHLDAAGADVDLIGPESLPYGGEAGQSPPWPATYADPAFDQDHDALWGDSLALPGRDRVAFLAAHQPDVVVLELGANDFAWLGQGPQDVVVTLTAWVNRAREVSPDTDFVLVEVPWTTTFADASVGDPCPASPTLAVCRAGRFNGLLPEVARDLATPASRVVIAHAADGYVMGRDDDRPADTYDAIHPNTRGQVKIAAAVSDALAELSVGEPYPRPLAVPSGGAARPGLLASGATDSAHLLWNRPPGTTSYDLWMREQVEGVPWRRELRAYSGTGHSVRGLSECASYDFQVIARKGWTAGAPESGSAIVTARVGAPVTERPTVRASVRGSGVRLEWDAVAHACEYVVRARSVLDGAVRREVHLVSGTGLDLTDLAPGAVTAMTVEPVGAQGPGPTSEPELVTVPVGPVGVSPTPQPTVPVTVTPTPSPSTVPTPTPTPTPATRPGRVGAVTLVVRRGAVRTVRWARVAGASGYLVQVGTARRWLRATTATAAAHARLRGVRGVRRVRVAATGPGGRGAWSRVARVTGTPDT